MEESRKIVENLLEQISSKSPLRNIAEIVRAELDSGDVNVVHSGELKQSSHDLVDLYSFRNDIETGENRNNTKGIVETIESFRENNFDQCNLRIFKINSCTVDFFILQNRSVVGLIVSK